MALTIAEMEELINKMVDCGTSGLYAKPTDWNLILGSEEGDFPDVKYMQGDYHIIEDDGGVEYFYTYIAPSGKASHVYWSGYVSGPIGVAVLALDWNTMVYRDVDFLWAKETDANQCKTFRLDENMSSSVGEVRLKFKCGANFVTAVATDRTLLGYEPGLAPV